MKQVPHAPDMYIHVHIHTYMYKYQSSMYMHVVLPIPSYILANMYKYLQYEHKKMNM